MRQIFLDTETTGFSPSKDRVVEIAAIAYHDGAPIPPGECGEYHRYINPQREIPWPAQKIHGLDSAFLADKPVFGDIADSLIDFISDSELIAHNAAFDCRILNGELSRLGYRPLEEVVASVTCAMTWSRRNNACDSHSLDFLCDRFGIDLGERRRRHGAMLDARLLARLYFKMICQRQNNR